jgi:phenylacetic acid degradation operon negative regulatory protein
VELTARTLILDLLSTVRRGAMPVGCLVEAGALFGFAPNNLRVSLSKLHADGRVVRDERGQYRLGAAAAALSDRLRPWRRLEDQQRAWKGTWLAVYSPRAGRAAERRRRERALALMGFREFGPLLSIRPDNLRLGVEGVRRYFASLPEPAFEPPLVYGIHDLDPAADLRARSLWDADALSQSYRSFTARLRESTDRVAALSTDEAMVETFLVGAGAVRFLHLDPLLPVEILDPKPRETLVAATREYDELGRSLWAPFLARHHVPNFGSRGGWRAPLGALPETALQEIQHE